MDNKWHRCFICNQEYNEKDIKPLFIYNEEKKQWDEINKLEYQGEIVPLCSEHLRMYALIRLTQRHYKVDFKK